MTLLQVIAPIDTFSPSGSGYTVTQEGINVTDSWEIRKILDAAAAQDIVILQDGVGGLSSNEALLATLADIEDERIRADAAYTPSSHQFASDPHGDRAFSEAQRLLLAADPIGLGPVTLLGSYTSGSWGAANDAIFVRLLGGGVISKIRFHCGTPSGNVVASAWSGAGIGLSRVPAVRLAASAPQAMISGYNDVPLGASVLVAAGDFLCLAVDNPTATVAALNGSTSNLYVGLYYKQTGAFPVPATVGTLIATGSKVPQLAGIA